MAEDEDGRAACTRSSSTASSTAASSRSGRRCSSSSARRPRPQASLSLLLNMLLAYECSSCCGPRCRARAGFMRRLTFVIFTVGRRALPTWRRTRTRSTANVRSLWHHATLVLPSSRPVLLLLYITNASALNPNLFSNADFTGATGGPPVADNLGFGYNAGVAGGGRRHLQRARLRQKRKAAAKAKEKVLAELDLRVLLEIELRDLLVDLGLHARVANPGSRRRSSRRRHLRLEHRDLGLERLDARLRTPRRARPRP